MTDLENERCFPPQDRLFPVDRLEWCIEQCGHQITVLSFGANWHFFVTRTNSSLGRKAICMSDRHEPCSLSHSLSLTSLTSLFFCLCEGITKDTICVHVALFGHTIELEEGLLDQLNRLLSVLRILAEQISL